MAQAPVTSLGGVPNATTSEHYLCNTLAPCGRASESHLIRAQAQHRGALEISNAAGMMIWTEPRFVELPHSPRSPGPLGTAPTMDMIFRPRLGRCFYCLTIYPPVEITDWLEHRIYGRLEPDHPTPCAVSLWYRRAGSGARHSVSNDHEQVTQQQRNGREDLN